MHRTAGPCQRLVFSLKVHSIGGSLNGSFCMCVLGLKRLREPATSDLRGLHGMPFQSSVPFPADSDSLKCKGFWSETCKCGCSGIESARLVGPYNNLRAHRTRQEFNQHRLVRRFTFSNSFRLSGIFVRDGSSSVNLRRTTFCRIGERNSSLRF